MVSLRASLRTTTLPIRRLYSSQHAFQPVPTIVGPLELISLDDFRSRAFKPEKPLLITAGDVKGMKEGSRCGIPAAEKWFTRGASSSKSALKNEGEGEYATLSHQYLSPYASTILPYELITPKSPDRPDTKVATHDELSHLLKQHTQYSPPDSTFHHFFAPLSLFLLASQSLSPSPSPNPNSNPPQQLPPPQLYIAQAQLLSLPPSLQFDLPTPHLVLHSDKGDIYDSNLWLGIPPTYTPLHKDPNPNLFVQLAGRKRVRIFEPGVGGSIFRDVQERIWRGEGGGGGGGVGSAQMRGSEMMEGPERELLFEAVWGEREGEGLDGGAGDANKEDQERERGYEAVVGPGDAVFIPKGWWHSFRSVGNGITGSVNWWFR